MKSSVLANSPVPLPEPTSETALRQAAARPLPVISTSAQLLLMCARESLDKEQREVLQQLCKQIEDWSVVVQQARFRLIVALVYHHLSRMPRGLVPEPVIDELKNSARRVTFRGLKMTAVHHRLVNDVLLPLKIPYLFFKGPSLAYTFYREPALRQFRDIDLLIPRRYMVVVGQRLRTLGFQPYPDSRFASDSGLHFQQRFIGMMDWISPEGVLVEVPSSLDDWDRLPTDELITNADHVKLGALSIPVPSSTDLFCYLCKHHTRHHWARLHWIADLNVIRDHESFDLQAIRKRAEHRDLKRTVDAALAIQRAVALPEPWEAKFSDPFAHELFRHCLTNLDGDFAQELALRESFPATSIDIDPAVRRKKHWVDRNFSRFRPRQEDFLQLPLSSRWQWLYYVLRPFLWMAKRFSRK